MEYISPQLITDAFIDRFDRWFDEVNNDILPPPPDFLMVEAEPEPEPTKRGRGRPSLNLPAEEHKRRKAERDKAWRDRQPKKEKTLKKKVNNETYYQRHKEEIKIKNKLYYQQKKQEKQEEANRLLVLNQKFLDEQKKLAEKIDEFNIDELLN